MARNLPLFVCFLIGAGVALLVPALAAFGLGDYGAATSFFLTALLTLIIAVLVAIATNDERDTERSSRSHLSTILASFAVLPVIGAVPLFSLLPDLAMEAAYFEMVSALTTTGATVFADTGTLSLPINLWRSIVGWLGGFMILLTAFSILEPMRLGGFELQNSRFSLSSATTIIRARSVGGPTIMFRTAAFIAPVYIGATAFLTFLLIVFGDDGFVAMCHAMAVISTSGISPVNGLAGGGTGLAAEVAILLFLGLALTHRFYAPRWDENGVHATSFEKEPKLAFILLSAVAGVVFLRHFSMALDMDNSAATEAVGALWGIIFTSLSYLTTTGFESSAWSGIEDWSGSPVTGIVLLSLALMGGGIATTAGGVKLLRVYALYKHGMREMERLVHPSSVGGFGSTARQVRREGAYIAWMFLMIFFLTIAIGATMLSLLGLGFEASLVMTIAALANTGPLIGNFGPEMPSFGGVSPPVRAVLNALMVLGRMEALAVIALFNPEYWRR